MGARASRAGYPAPDEGAYYTQPFRPVHRNPSALTPNEKDAISQSSPPVIVPRADHPISRANISPNALKVLYRLNDAGYQAFLVGGAVRDLLLGLSPKDFDVATNAHPEEVRKLFRNC